MPARRRIARALLTTSLVVSGAFASAHMPVLGEEEPWLRVTFLDFRQVDGAMGHGDAALYEAWCGERGAVDISQGAGRELLDLLDARGSRALEWIVASHYHSDHIGAIVDVAESPDVTVETVYDRGGTPDDPALANDVSATFADEYYPWVTSDATTRQPVDTGDQFALCGGTSAPVTFDVLSAGTDGTAAGGIPVVQENDKSLCLSVSLGDFDLATCGDINGSDGRDEPEGDDGRRDVETSVARAFGDVEFVHVNHHGHGHSSNQTYVSTLAPAAVVISSGRTVDAEVMASWSAVAAIYQTGGDPDSVDGDVVVETTGSRTFTVQGLRSGRTASYSLDEGPPSTTSTTSTPSTTSTTSTSGPSGPESGEVRQTRSAKGYRMLSASGAVYAFGEVGWHGNSIDGSADIETSPVGDGYWVVTRTGHVSAHGAALHLGAGPTLAEGEEVSALSATPEGDGYWLFTTAGRVFAYGTARHFGDLSGVRLNGPVHDAIASPSGRGYYLVATDGGVFAFGDARFRGSMGGITLNAPALSLVPDADGGGYWLVASDGGVFAFGDAGFHGSMGGTRLNMPVTGMVRYGHGYLMVAADGGVFAFSSQPFFGSLGHDPPPSPIVSVTS